jgi:N-acetylneuraminic acid mutarotase
VREGEEPGRAEADAAQPAGPWVSEPFVPPLRPLPWFKRVALVASLALVAAVMALGQPRAVAVPAEVCGDEFTAACVSEENGLVAEEPESVWVSLATMPEARGRFALVAMGNTLYVVGGETPGGVTGSLAIYDVETDAWREGAPKPVAVANLAAVTHEGRIYAIGGRNQAGEPMALVEVYDPVTDSWSEGVALPRAVMAHVAVAAGERILVFGGSDGTSYRGLAWGWEAGEGRWQALPILPTPRGFMGAAVMDGRVYLVGGYDGQREYATCDWFDLEAQIYGVCPSMSSPRGGVGAAAVAGNLFVVGGGWSSFTAFSERYNPRSDQWYNVETPVLLAGGEWLNLGVAGVGTQILALGGWQQGRYLNLNQAYETLPNRLYLPATTAGGN